jgi:predicted AlkP superfamily pyrophosphatase or phosphodiesterase
MRYLALLCSGIVTAYGCRPAVSSSDGTAAVPTARGSGGVNSEAHLAKPYVILISFDGFRADYLDRYNAPNFSRVVRAGVRAQRMIPVFPSKTFPNHYSIATGDYPETHGIVSNRFWDPARNAAYALGDPKSVLDGTWYRGEPIWVTAEKQGMVTASYFWVGSEAPIEGIRPWTTKRFGDSVSNSARSDSALAWLARPPRSRPHLITMYMSDVDHAGHEYGPDDPHVQTAINSVDSALGRLLDGIATSPVKDDTYVILVADHGMSPYEPFTYKRMRDMIDTVGVRLGDGGPAGNLHVTGGKARARILRESLNRHLQHGRAYLREEVPARFHYRSDPRIGDIVVIMDEHWQFGARAPSRPGGQHGWDPLLPSMGAIFVASGPGIPAGRVIAPFENIHIYPFIAEILGLRPASHIDGKIGFLRSAIIQ